MPSVIEVETLPFLKRIDLLVHTQFTQVQRMNGSEWIESAQKNSIEM